jgi:hypothetical protein
MRGLTLGRAFTRWRQDVASAQQIDGEVARLGAARGRLERQQEAAATLVRRRSHHMTPGSLLPPSLSLSLFICSMSIVA